ncbi:MAG TPA: MFS transporter [Terriglobia bacterium]|jgi:MFS family permease|nr:MFS transporter [Terriglobia bacterium]
MNPPNETQTSTAYIKVPGSGISNTRRWAVMWLLFIASIINYLDRSAISFALPLISHDLHLGPESKGVLLSSFFWSYTLMQVPIGLISDRMNLLWVYAGAFALWSLAQGLTGLAGSLMVLILLRIVLGLGEAIYLPGGTKIVSLLFDRSERGLPSGFFDSGTRFGLVVGGVGIPWLLVRFGWRDAFVLVGILGLLWLVPWFIAFPSKPAKIRQREARESGPEAQARFRLVHFDRNLLGVCLGFFCFDYFWYLMLTWLPDYLYEARHLSIIKAGFFSAMPYAVFGVCQPLGGWIADRLIHRGWNETLTRKMMVTIGFIFGLLMIPAALTQSATIAVALIVGAGLVGLSTANQLVIVQSCAPHHEVGVWTGFLNFAGNIGGVAAPLITGFLIAWTGSFVSAFILGPALLVSGSLAYWFIVGKLVSPRHKPDDETAA